MQTEKHSVKNNLNRFRSFRYVLILEGIVTGVVGGGVVILFRYLLTYADKLLQMVLSHGQNHIGVVACWFIVLVAGAMIVARLLKWEGFISGSGIPQVEGEMIGALDPCWWRVLVAKMTGGLLSIGCGLSLGREGPSIQLGAMAAKGFSRITKRAKTEEKLLITCGASAGLSAAFNAPLAGVLFSLEEIHKHFSPEVLLSTMAASITADFLSSNVFGLKPVFGFHITQMMPLSTYGHAILLGVILGGLGVVYNTCLAKTQDLFQKIPNQFGRLLIPFLLAGVLGFSYPYVLGGGHSLVETLTSEQLMVGALCLLLILKFSFSMLSFGSGAPGGIFLPLLVLGAVMGSLYYSIMGQWTDSLNGLLDNFIILGMAGYFAAIVRAPITGIILISEMTGSFSHLLTLSLVSLIAYVIPDMVHCPPVYDQLLHRLLLKLNPEQKNVYSGEKVLVEGMIFHGCEAEGKMVSQIPWPAKCLLVSLIRGQAEFVPRGETIFAAGDKIVVLCDEADQKELHEVLRDVCGTVKR
ncbi:ClC family H(+)/Cl(-) exchange transporter [Aminipila butyrica]|uniref:ClC family H(+)/Cl(-) exchange transporter n=1 Tax=Aminipila butyrica TaxID=433296 RepID=A0A858BSY2_9FIRM|nr:ClC family H(+)/Cl(-) exchange transporter [Aminipila butyrica]QIB68215.1 ClC family H(+)/Cl(-) exchange transporter [Aminipila butyrica]